MGYYEDQLAAANKSVKDLIAAPDSSSARIGGRLSGVADQFEGGVRDIIGGVDPTIISPIQGKLKRRATNTQRRVKMESYQDKLNARYRHAFENYISAGKSVTESDAFARQWAQDQINMEFQAEQAEKGRAVTRERADIAKKYDTGNIPIPQSDPYQAALTRALFGLGTTAATYGIVSKMGKKAPAQPGQTANLQGTYAGQLEEAFDREAVRPYTSDFGTRGRVKFP